jgi:predicted porin
VRYDATLQLTLIGAGYRVLANPGHGSATLLMLGADYRLSKRTFLYASLGGVSNSAQANFAADVSVSGPGKVPRSVCCMQGWAIRSNEDVGSSAITHDVSEVVPSAVEAGTGLLPVS